MYSTLKRSTKPMRKVSERRLALEKAREECVRIVKERDRNRCQFAVKLAAYVHEYGMLDLPNGSQRCFGPIHLHEPAHRRNSDITDPDQCLLLCNGHNGWVEDHPVLAEVLGLFVKGNGLPLRHVRIIP